MKTRMNALMEPIIVMPTPPAPIPMVITCECNDGYTGDGTACEDIDECAEAIDNCHEQASCTNDMGSFSCVCNQGYEGDIFVMTLTSVQTMALGRMLVGPLNGGFAPITRAGS